MNSLLGNTIFQAVERTYPFPLAFMLRVEVLEAATPQQQAEGLIRLANTALPYATLIAASNFAMIPFKEEQLSYRFEKLKRPLLSDFAQFLRRSVPALHQQGFLFIPEMMEMVEQIQKEKVPTLRMGEEGLEQRQLPLGDALINLSASRESPYGTGMRQPERLHVYWIIRIISFSFSSQVANSGDETDDRSSSPGFACAAEQGSSTTLFCTRKAGCGCT